MPRSRFMLSSSVILSDAYLAMSAEAQALNVILNAEADVTGRIIGIRRIVRGSGLGTDALAELYREGYLLKVGNGDTYIAHMWQHNKYDKRLWERMRDCEPYTSGELVFVGDEGKSAYALAELIDAKTTPERRSSVDEGSRNGNGNGNGNPTGKATKPQGQPNSREAKEKRQGEFEGEGDVSAPLCPRCGGALREIDKGYLACDACRGVFPVADIGELRR